MITSPLQPAVFTSLAPLKTPYGLLQINTDFYQKTLQSQPDLISEQDFTAKNLQNLYAPFVKKNFPQANYLPLFISEKITETQLSQLAESLRDNLPAKTLIIVKSSLLIENNDPQLSEFQQKFVQNVLENMDQKALPQLPLNSISTVRALWHYLDFIHAQKVTTAVWPKPATVQGETQNPAMPNSPVQNSINDPLLQLFTEGPKISTRKTFMVVFGDIMLGRYVRTLMDKSSLDYPFQKMNQNYLQIL